MEFFLFCALAGAQKRTADLKQFTNYSTGEGMDEWLDAGDEVFDLTWDLNCAFGNDPDSWDRD